MTRSTRVVAAGLQLLVAGPLFAQQTTSFTVGSATPGPGKTAYGAISIPAGSDSATNIPVAVIRGVRPGPVVAFVAGSHGTEYSSIVAMQQLIGRIDATKLAGTVIVAPLLNIASFEQMTPHINPIDRKGMNGGYPGDASGTQTARVLAAVTEQIVTPATVVVDLHGGDIDEDLRPYSYWFRGGRAAQDSAGLKLALAFGLDHIIVSDVDPSSPTAGRSLSGIALVRGKTVLVAEAGRSGVVAPSDLEALVDGSLNVLGELHMLDRHVTHVAKPVWLAGAGARVAADSAGVFIAAVARDTRVTKGQVVGHTTDFLGRPTGDIRAPIDGLVTFIRGVPSMWPRATLVNVAPVLSGPGEWKVSRP
ncbi:MAG TPA: succinylglutamate desuccinylase/aspartoacylase family protein [Gemmatimonadaceae bacterium]|nr:succinylglutamate desuccinylase/aspartoacylase family protein [Gemmatimonadaceae bacterium]